MQSQRRRRNHFDSATYIDCLLQQVHGRGGFGGYEASTLQLYHYGPESVVAETFFYLLDVGTSNALVLYNESMKIRLETTGQYTPMNIVKFKMQLVEDLVGKKWTNCSKAGGQAE